MNVVSLFRFAHVDYFNIPFCQCNVIVCMYTCMYASNHIYIHIYIRTYKHTYIHTYIHAYIHTYIHAYLRKNIHSYMTIIGKHTCLFIRVFSEFEHFVFVFSAYDVFPI